MHLDIIFKTFVGVLVAVMITSTGLAVITGFSKSVAANNYMESVSKVIVESNYAPNVINACIMEATDNGYSLDVKVERARKAGVKVYAEIALSYCFEIKLLGIKQNRILKKIW